MALRILFLTTFLVLAGAAVPVPAPAPPPEEGVTIHVINGVSEKLRDFVLHLSLFDNNIGTIASIDLRRGEEYSMMVGYSPNPALEGEFRLGSGGARTFNVRSTSDPIQDKGRANIYWKADEAGVSLSYDNAHYKKYGDWKPDL